MAISLSVKNSSILLKVSLAFLFMYILSTIFFIYAYNQSKDKELRDFTRRGLLAVYSNNPEEIGQSVVEIKDYDTYKTVTSTGKTLLDKNLGFVQIRIIEYQNELFLLINRFGMSYLLKKNDNNIEIHKLISIGYVMFNIAFLLLYINIVKSFYHLKQLRNKIRLLKAGNFDIKIETDREDEIGFIAKEFNEAVRSLKRNEELRKWFLRNIAHELKTPITKGKIAIELLEDERGKENFERIFNRLEYLVNQLLLMEKVSSEKFTLNRECLSLKEVVEDSIELLLIPEKENVSVQIETPDNVYVDRTIFPIAIKNLLDNAIKFSEDNKAKLTYTDKTLYVKNRGEKPPIDINLLFEPFIKETSIKNKDGLGLGLYITKFILHAHGLRVDYNYVDGNNIFSINLESIRC
ncbi:MAG: ArsS family sensor histidine kinase [Hydrogenothermaceae bacterium]|nr:ArsS family sensor histidine kinase [Hydrogenothermaceae bacterium]